MTQRTSKGLSQTNETENDGKAGHEDGDLGAGTFEAIGFLAGTILSRVKARKETTGAGEIRSGGQHAQATRGVIASNGKENGGAVDVVRVLADLPTLLQQPPVTQTKSKVIKDRAVTRSANG
ncbi:hypothetical protein AB4Y96_09090 [Phyllobacterium sp. TAF24]|uniref:hypothetical protein n=1 Tax=Phyllobacterium sp. TAF24 TaxID=3233068 RepID=UPI003F94AB9B